MVNVSYNTAQCSCERSFFHFPCMIKCCSNDASSCSLIASMCKSDFSCLVSYSRCKHTQGTNFYTDFPLGLQNIPPSHISQSLPASHLTITIFKITVGTTLECSRDSDNSFAWKSNLLKRFARGQLIIGVVAIIKGVVATPTSCFRFSTHNLHI